MVKLSLSVIALAATLVSIVAASPYCREETTVFRSIETEGRESCLSGAPDERQTFSLLDSQLQRFLSKRGYNNLVLGGGESRELKQLQFCVVNTRWQTCSATSPNKDACLNQDKSYKIRVHAPVKGYLKINDNDSVSIVDTYNEASFFKFTEIEEKTVRISSPMFDLTLSTDGLGEPVRMERYDDEDEDQMFHFTPPAFY
ncbi:MAG: hypothetical protein J3Q66DRAFT_169684 [Benniella sp.]|nr:MAG: hypothetical protein J3Q66DRAFT_169684 [Benniella sp.]